jgi:cytochrome-b5 reductase
MEVLLTAKRAIKPRILLKWTTPRYYRVITENLPPLLIQSSKCRFSSLGTWQYQSQYSAAFLKRAITLSALSGPLVNTTRTSTGLNTSKTVYGNVRTYHVGRNRRSVHSQTQMGPVRRYSNLSDNPKKPSSRPIRKSTKITLVFSSILMSIAVYKLYVAFGFENPLDPTEFHTFTIIAKERVSSNTAIFTLDPSKKGSGEGYDIFWRRGLWSVEFKQPDLQIARAYTPLPPLEPSRPRIKETWLEYIYGLKEYFDSDEKSHENSSAQGSRLRFFIRTIEGGEVSNYIDALPISSKLSLRGPNPEFDVPDDVESVVFLAGGTGIAPALQMAHTLLIRTQDGGGLESVKPTIHILWASRRREDCLGGENITNRTSQSTGGFKDAKKGLIVDQLEILQALFPGRLNVEYYVDEEGTYIKRESIVKAVRDASPSGSGSETALRIDISATSRNKNHLIISGPDGFNAWLGGPKKMRRGRESEEHIGGEVGQLMQAGMLEGWSVRKL